MLSKFLALFLLFATSAQALPIHVSSPKANIDITTSKFATIEGTISYPSEFAFEEQVAATINLPGPRVIIINSPGGSVDVGQRLIDLMLKEKATGTKMICVSAIQASSMAFNFLSLCDIKLSIANCHFVAHRVSWGAFDPHERLTAKLLREKADEMDKIDEVFDKINASAMHISLKEYSKIADEERLWSAATLYLMGYLDGIATVDDPNVSPTL